MFDPPRLRELLRHVFNLRDATVMAARYGVLESLRMLLAADGRATLGEAARAPKGSSVAVARLLLENGADVDGVGVRDDGSVRGYTPLMAAVEYDDVPLVQFLLPLIRKGIDERDSNGFTAAFYASSVKTLQCLAEAGADMKVAAPDGTTLLYNWEHEPCIEWLITEHHLDPNVRDRRGVTPLHTVIDLELFRPLLEAGRIRMRLTFMGRRWCVRGSFRIV